MIADISLIVTAVGVMGAWFSLRQSYRERLRQLESRYVERYWKILDQLSLDALRATAKTKNPKVSPCDERAIRSYIILCEDEVELRKNGYISDATYKEWTDGIRGQFLNPMFQKVWNQVWQDANDKQTFPYANLAHLLGERQEAGEPYDPLEMSDIKRITRGLKGVTEAPRPFSWSHAAIRLRPLIAPGATFSLKSALHRASRLKTAQPLGLDSTDGTFGRRGGDTTESLPSSRLGQ